MNPAPGFDELMPHDLCHLIVEQVLHIENAIYGQISNNGTAGSFRYVSSESSISKNDSRQRHKAAKKGKKMVRENLEDLAKSERASYICWQNWLSHSSDQSLQFLAEEMKKNAENIFKQMSSAERAIYTKENLARVRERMTELSRQWQNLKTGESMTVIW